MMLISFDQGWHGFFVFRQAERALSVSLAPDVIFLVFLGKHALIIARNQTVAKRVTPIRLFPNEKSL